MSNCSSTFSCHSWGKATQILRRAIIVEEETSNIRTTIPARSSTKRLSCCLSKTSDHNHNVPKQPEARFQQHNTKHRHTVRGFLMKLPTKAHSESAILLNKGVKRKANLHNIRTMFGEMQRLKNYKHQKHDNRRMETNFLTQLKTNSAQASGTLGTLLERPLPFHFPASTSGCALAISPHR